MTDVQVLFNDNSGRKVAALFYIEVLIAYQRQGGPSQMVDPLSHNCEGTDITVDLKQKRKEGGAPMFKPKYRFTYEEVRIIVMALVELKNSLLAEGRYTDPVDELLLKFVD